MSTWTLGPGGGRTVCGQPVWAAQPPALLKGVSPAVRCGKPGPPSERFTRLLAWTERLEATTGPPLSHFLFCLTRQDWPDCNVVDFVTAVQCSICLIFSYKGYLSPGKEAANLSTYQSTRFRNFRASSTACAVYTCSAPLTGNYPALFVDVTSRAWAFHVSPCFLLSSLIEWSCRLPKLQWVTSNCSSLKLLGGQRIELFTQPSWPKPNTEKLLLPPSSRLFECGKQSSVRGASSNPNWLRFRIGRLSFRTSPSWLLEASESQLENRKAEAASCLAQLTDCKR